VLNTAQVLDDQARRFADPATGKLELSASELPAVAGLYLMMKTPK